MSRLRQPGRTAAVELLPRTIGDGCLADEVDAIQVNESREIGFAMRELLMARASMPEAQTCVHCQDGIERRGRPLRGGRRSVFAVSDDRVMAGERQASLRASYFPNEEDRAA